jgi:BirA family biotin operon repressor/biotin-[acetyl-CoA-carboxylase] ligase
LAVVEGIAEVTDLRPKLKWPNDVLLFDPDLDMGADLDTDTDPGHAADRKVAGILAELTRGPAGPVVVIGLGINVSLTEAELPVPTAISLSLAGATVDRTDLAAAVLRALSRRLDQWPDELAAVADDYRNACATLGHRVRVQMPAAEEIEGVATAIDSVGRVVVEIEPGNVIAVAAGDVTHLRVAD